MESNNLEYSHEDNSPAVRPSFGNLPLKHMNYTGSLVGVTADMGLDLVYGNTLEHPIEAVFTFPLVPEATVTDLEVFIGEKRVAAELREKEQARKDYDTARDAGHHAALMEQERPNIFSMSVGGIEPGEEVRVAVRYMHRVDWQAGGGRFTLPLVVAPHFVPGSPLEHSQGNGFAPDTDQVPNASLITPRVATDPAQITYDASLKLALRPGFSAFVNSPSHELLVQANQLEAEQTYDIELNNLQPDRDLILTYKSLERKPSVSVDTTQWQRGEAERENFVMLQVMPPLLAQAKADKREVVLCLDNSGSMDGLPIENLKRVTKKIIERLDQGAQDLSLGLMTFNSAPSVIQNLKPLDGTKNLLKSIDEIHATGGTRASLALNTALGLFSPETEQNVERSIIFVSDGDTYDINANFDLRKNVRIHCVGISSAIDHEVMKDIASRTGGSNYWIHPGEDFDVATREIVSRTSGPLVHNLEIKAPGVELDVVGGKELWNEQPQTLIAKLGSELPKELIITGMGVDGEQINWVVNPELAHDLPVAASFWAREKLRDKLDYEVAKDLSLKYGVLSNSTAFVAVLEKEIPGEKPERIDIPVALPHGWTMEAGWGTLQVARGGAYLCAADEFELCGLADDYDDYDLGATSVLLFEDGDEELDCEHLGLTVEEPVFHELLELANNFYDQLRHNNRMPLGPEEEAQRWTEITDKLKLESDSSFRDWDPAQKAQLYMVLVRLRSYGFKAELAPELSQRPASDLEGLPYWQEAQRSLGVSINL